MRYTAIIQASYVNPDMNYKTLCAQLKQMEMDIKPSIFNENTTALATSRMRYKLKPKEHPKEFPKEHPKEYAKEQLTTCHDGMTICKGNCTHCGKKGHYTAECCLKHKLQTEA